MYESSKSLSEYRATPSLQIARYGATVVMTDAERCKTIRNQSACGIESMMDIMGTLLTFYVFATRLTFAWADSQKAPRSSLPLPIHLVHEFPKGTWVENLAVRSNGQILVTLLTSNELIQLDPLSFLKPVVVTIIPNTTSCLGIRELDPNHFYVLCGTVIKPLNTIKGSYSVWHIEIDRVSPSWSDPQAIRLPTCRMRSCQMAYAFSVRAEGLSSLQMP